MTAPQRAPVCVYESYVLRVGVSIDAPLHSIDSLDPDPSCSDNSFDEEVQSASRKPSGVRQEGAQPA